jgi:hypothetical protein
VSWGKLSEEQAELVARFIRGRTVHDLGCGDCKLAGRLVELGARRVVGVDWRKPSELPEGVAFHRLSYIHFARMRTKPDIAFVSWPAQYGTRGLVKLLESVPLVLYLGCNDAGTVCGSRSLFEHLRTREALGFVEHPDNDLIVYGVRRLKRELLDHERRAIRGQEWLCGDDPDEAREIGLKVIRALRAQRKRAAAEDAAGYRIETKGRTQ